MVPSLFHRPRPRTPPPAPRVPPPSLLGRWHIGPVRAGPTVHRPTRLRGGEGSTAPTDRCVTQQRVLLADLRGGLGGVLGRAGERPCGRLRSPGQGPGGLPGRAERHVLGRR